MKAYFSETEYTDFLQNLWATIFYLVPYKYLQRRLYWKESSIQISYFWWTSGGFHEDRIMSFNKLYGRREISNLFRSAYLTSPIEKVLSVVLQTPPFSS